MDVLSYEEKAVLSMVEDEYVVSGYIHSRSVTPSFVAAKLEWSLSQVRKAIHSLVEIGLMRRRNCQAYAFELVPMYRIYLIQSHMLSERWAERECGRGRGRVSRGKEEVATAMRETGCVHL